MSPQVSTIMLAVRDLDRAKQFYVDGMDAKVKQAFPGYVMMSLGEGTSTLALHEWDAEAQEAGVSPEGSGFRGVTFHFITDTRESVDEVIAKAEAAGATVTKKPEAAPWGGYYGYFADTEGYLWKAATSS